MRNKIIREIDHQGRIPLPRDLLILAGLSLEDELVLCSMGHSMIKLKKLSECRQHKVIGKTNIRDKGRLIVPLELRECEQKYEVFVFNGDLILKEAP